MAGSAVREARVARGVGERPLPKRGAGLSSELILEAVAATRATWPHVPELGLITFVDPRKIRRKRDPGRCYRRAGFELVGETKDLGLLVFQLLPAKMPDACPAIGTQMTLAA